jgi:PadR family transcriptional regulator PadR
MSRMAEEPLHADALQILENLRGELRRGGLVLAVLGQLATEHYGYTLRKALAARGLPVDEGTLYPLLRRLESQGLLLSEWREEDKRQKRFYRLSSVGRQVVRQLAGDWQDLNHSIARVLEDRES